MLARLREQFPRLGHVVETERIARRMRRVRIAGETLRDLPCSRASSSASWGKRDSSEPT